MNSETLAVIIYEECASRTRTTKECIEAIKLRTGITSDIEDTIRRYRQSGSGLEKAAKEILGCCSAVGSAPACQSPYDSLVTLFNERSFQNAEDAARICTLLKGKGMDIDLNTVEEMESDYRCISGLKVGECLYIIESEQSMFDSAVESRGEGIAECAYDIARDEVRDMDHVEMAEYAGYYDGVKEIETTDKPDELLISFDL